MDIFVIIFGLSLSACAGWFVHSFSHSLKEEQRRMRRLAEEQHRRNRQLVRQRSPRAAQTTTQNQPADDSPRA
ncbi:MAG TPA: hypothetical protein VJT82_02410 [Pyrinomonadaceae bacterium]|nr:hypothetical protein [Pyrinomonadaceae bacterium]